MNRKKVDKEINEAKIIDSLTIDTPVFVLLKTSPSSMPIHNKRIITIFDIKLTR
ncbi:hypothetical protein XBFM1_700011 [Xenorhabdus bovienii str. feltiae Moldova]|uniref:Uncharacterized protein n=1 Tax=Xenorhabdus bovienii str. feltiae Moldova TaxID=1398200 RepID=A0A077NWV8_XENBV|nr:hypothetical protein XBFM1_700011 [Xenorhabdus bovienii str. feltiae Moldova]